ncbi:MAG: DNA repair protein RecN [Deltaproteobacteria bacterium]|nr:DNA repair protein RecN [Deltaproteobacteria bacterium]
MLKKLRVRNLAIIEDVTLDLEEGFTVFTGETGAGKSILLNALLLLRGARADSDLIRKGATEATAEGIFQLPSSHPILKTLLEKGIPLESELLLKRTLNTSGRSQAWINGEIATLSMLQEVGGQLIEICGQQEHQTLLQESNHLELLDLYGGLERDRELFEKIFQEWQEALRTLEVGQGKEKELQEHLELYRFQLLEIERLGVQRGEDERLEEERNRLRHGAALREAVASSEGVLYSNTGSVIEQVGQVLRWLESASRIDLKLAESLEMVKAARISVEEAARELERYLETIDMDPERLDKVESRLYDLEQAKRKYGGTLDAVLDHQSRLQSELQAWESRGERLEALKEKVVELEVGAQGQAEVLSIRRRKAASELAKGVGKELQELAMSSAEFSVAQERGDLRAKGWDRVTFYLAANRGENARPLAKVASGGELSRIMLALKTVFLKNPAVTTVVFDEIDSGIGGAVAEGVGKKLSRLARYQQVLCITHQAQIASQAMSHFVIKKKEMQHRTQVQVESLSEGERVGEISRMLGGVQITSKVRAHARELLG